MRNYLDKDDEEDRFFSDLEEDIFGEDDFRYDDECPDCGAEWDYCECDR